MCFTLIKTTPNSIAEMIVRVKKIITELIYVKFYTLTRTHTFIQITDKVT